MQGRHPAAVSIRRAYFTISSGPYIVAFHQSDRVRMIGFSMEESARAVDDVITTKWAKVLMDTRLSSPWRLLVPDTVPSNARKRFAGSMRSRARHRCRPRLTSSLSIRATASGFLASLRNELRVLCMPPSLTSGPRVS